MHDFIEQAKERRDTFVEEIETLDKSYDTATKLTNAFYQHKKACKTVGCQVCRDMARRMLSASVYSLSLAFKYQRKVNN